ncbi:reverse transcriptase domain-containing protein [Nocardiopsis synnemataformans]|uniref:reverse transcriptase/maturase family protein n=1 Tax=Nocardiopsis synnemataformans TaxID=61305 RepID=UPI003EBF9F67
MQSAETVLDVLRERGRRDLPCEELYRQLFNPHLYFLAYQRIYSNQGAMTPGSCGETADGMSESKIGSIIDAMRHERYRFMPARRVYIPKANGKKRPLGLPSWSDKMVGEAIRLLLEAYYEPRFSDRSHGFRPRRGCHTALTEVANVWAGTTWFIEGDISDCFGSLDHQVMVSTLAEKIHDNRFLRLIKQMLQAGYLEDWVWNATLSGAPQGGVASPILSNIYLDRLDSFVETVLIPEYTRGKARIKNPAYYDIEKAIKRTRHRLRQKKEDTENAPEIRELHEQLRRLPSGDPKDPGYRRLRYIRYADDHLLGFIGPKAEAEEIKQRLAAFLRDDLKLELNGEKTLITHARTGAARFLGYEITIQHCDSKISRGGRVRRGARATNGKVALRVPRTVIKAKCDPYLRRGDPTHLPHLMTLTDYNIVRLYGTQYQGVVQYYLLAADVWRLDRLKGVMLTSMLKTLAAKHRSSVTKTAKKHRTVIITPYGRRRCFEARVERSGRKPLVARFGGIPLKRHRKAVMQDRLPDTSARPRGNELIHRLKRGNCELCETKAEVQVHQVKVLADLASAHNPQPPWAELMTRMRRKTLIVCPPCHESIHAG